MKQKIFFKLVFMGALSYGLLLVFIGFLAFVGMKQVNYSLLAQNFQQKILFFGLILTAGIFLIFFLYVFLIKLSMRTFLLAQQRQNDFLESKDEKKTEQKIGIDAEREKFIDSLKTEFVAIAAHQLRTPISAIKWIIKMLMDEDIGPLTKEQKDYLTKAYLSNERMVKLINDLLCVTRIEEGRFLNKQKKADLIENIESALALWKGAAERKGLKFEFHKPNRKTPFAFVDAEKVALALQNLIDNAIHYTSQGEIVVKVDFLKGKNEFQISVKDTGIGIPKDQQSKVFSRFFRAGNAVKMETEGTGLGLYIARSIAQAHGGRMFFESEEGKGTTFYFTVPAYS